MTETSRDPEYDQRVRVSFARQAAMATLNRRPRQTAPAHWSPS